MKNRKSVMAVASLMILIYHLWVYVFSYNVIEQYLVRTAYIGVDIFFFLSGFALAGSKIDNYWSFVWARFKSIYLRFIFFAIAACLLSKWSILRLVQVILGIELFQKGGGSFLWFLPGIMIFYLIYPLFLKLYKKDPWLTTVLLVTVWAVVGIVVLRFTKYYVLYILFNRIPIFMGGFYTYKVCKTKKISLGYVDKLLGGISLIIIGTVLTYCYAYREKLQVPIPDMFYIVVIPLVLGIVLLVSFIPEVPVVKQIGESTLEMYGVQMVAGYKICNKFFKLTGNALATNILTILFVVAISVILSKIWQIIRWKLQKE